MKYCRACGKYVDNACNYCPDCGDPVIDTAEYFASLSNKTAQESVKVQTEGTTVVAKKGAGLNNKTGENPAVKYCPTCKKFVDGNPYNYCPDCGDEVVDAAEYFALLSNETAQESGKAQAMYTTAAVAAEKEAVAAGVREAGLYTRMGDNLSNLNTMRGGPKGFKGFVAEEMQATEASIAGRNTTVLNDNGIADLEYIGKNGHHYYQQLKVGYKPGQIDFAKYKGQTVVLDKGNPYLKQFQAEGRKFGVRVIEGDVTAEEAKRTADMMQMETSVTGGKNSKVVTSGIKAGGVLKASHNAGVQSAKTGAAAGAGFSLGTNLVDVVSGDKEVGQAATDVAKDTAVAGAAGYVVGAATTAIGSTSTGAAVIGAASGVGTAVASTTVGGAVIGAGSAAAATVGGAGAAAAGSVVGAVGAVGGAVGSAVTSATAGTVIGGAVASGVGTLGAGAAALGAAAVAAAPVVAVGAAVGVGYQVVKKVFGREERVIDGSVANSCMTKNDHIIRITSPVDGKVSKIKVEEEDYVDRGDKLIIIKSDVGRKEYVIKAPCDGRVELVNVYKNEWVAEDELLIKIDDRY